MLDGGYVEQKTHFVPVPAAALKKEQIDYYFQSLIAHDLLRYRIPEQKAPTMETVYSMLFDRNHACFMVLDDTTDLPCGEFMLTNFQGQSALIHFSIHPDYFGRQAVQMASEATDWLFTLKRADDNSLPYVVSILGLTPVSNRLACRFIRKVGFQPQIVVPKSYYLAYNDTYDDGVLSMKLRST